MSTPPRSIEGTTAGAGAGAAAVSSATGSDALLSPSGVHFRTGTAPSSILRDIIRDNQQFVLDSQVFSPMFIRFVYEIVSSIVSLPEGEPQSPQRLSAQDSSSPVDDLTYLRSQTVLEWATRFTLQVVAHSSDTAIMRDFVDKLIVLFKRCLPACRWLLAEAAAQPALALNALLTASDRRIRSNVARLLCEVMHVVLPVEASYLHDMELVGTSSTATQPRSRVARLLNCMLSMIPGAFALFVVGQPGYVCLTRAPNLCGRGVTTASGCVLSWVTRLGLLQQRRLQTGPSSLSSGGCSSS